MSGAALSSAKQRRSVLKDPQGNHIQTQQQAQKQQPQTQQQKIQGPPQVIPISQALTMFDRRINMLEQTVKNLVQQGSASPLIIPRADNQSINSEEMLEVKDSIHRLDEMMSNNQDIIEDMHTFATELDNLKNTIIKLQSYTMDVNRMLLENQNQTEHKEKQGIVIDAIN